LAPACARCPIATAACDPTVQASGCRPQNDPISVTVAFAASMASTALTVSFGVGWDPPLGNNARMTVSQNAIRKRNRMTCLQRARLWFAAFGRTLPAKLEILVLSPSRFLSIFEVNQPRFFANFEQSAFD
jgi:hypothetical protein